MPRVSLGASRQCTSRLMLTVVNTRPPSDSTVPADNTRADPSKVLDDGVLHHNATLQADTLANLDTRSDHDVGTDDGAWVDLGGGVN